MNTSDFEIFVGLEELPGVAPEILKCPVINDMKKVQLQVDKLKNL